MNNLLAKKTFLSVILVVIALSTHGKEKDFNLKADGKDKTFAESCREVESFYKRKVTCETSKEDYIGDYLVPLNIKSFSFWQTACEISKQSEYGFKSFFDGVIYNANEYNIIDYTIFNERPIVIKGPLFYKNDKGSEVAAIELGIYDTKGIFEFPDFLDVTLKNNNKSLKLESDGYEGGNNFSKYFSVPKEYLKKNIDVSFTLKSTTIKNTKQYDMIVKKGTKITDGDLTLKLTDVSKSAGILKIKYTLDWVSDLTKEETVRVKKIMAEFKKTFKSSDEDRKWQETLMTRKDLKNFRISSVKLFDKEGKEYTSRSSSSMGGPGIGIQGQCEFRLKNSPKKITFSIGDKKFIQKNILFKNLDLSDN